MCRKKTDLSGQRFGRLVVIGEANESGRVVCRCDCGNTKVIAKASLTSGATRSCGCLLRETSSATGRQHIVANVAPWWEAMRKYGTNVGAIARTEPRKNNKSGHTGVWFNPKTGVYEAYITFKRKKIHLGNFHNLAEAVQARQTAEEEIYAPVIAAMHEDLQMAIG